VFEDNDGSAFVVTGKGFTLDDCDIYHNYEGGNLYSGTQSFVYGTLLMNTRFHESGMTSDWPINLNAVTVVGCGVYVDGPHVKWDGTTTGEIAFTATVPTTCQEARDLGCGVDSDLSLNCYVSFIDYAMLAERWLDDSCSSPGDCDGADINIDGIVDMYDLKVFADEWLRCTEPTDSGCDKPWL
jgi:hypothetical protein